MPIEEGLLDATVTRCKKIKDKNAESEAVQQVSCLLSGYCILTLSAVDQTRGKSSLQFVEASFGKDLGLEMLGLFTLLLV